MPRPCAPNSGLRTSGPAASSRRATASAAARPSTAKVGGVSRPARDSRKLVIDLSTQRSIAAAEFQTGTPSCASACRMPSRRVTASKEPAPTARTSTASGSASPKPGMAIPEGCVASKASAASGSVRATALRRLKRTDRPPPRVAAPSLTMRMRDVKARPPLSAGSVGALRGRGRRRGRCRRCRSPSRSPLPG